MYTISTYKQAYVKKQKEHLGLCFREDTLLHGCACICKHTYSCSDKGSRCINHPHVDVLVRPQSRNSVLVKCNQMVEQRAQEKTSEAPKTKDTFFAEVRAVCGVCARAPAGLLACLRLCARPRRNQGHCTLKPSKGSPHQLCMCMCVCVSWSVLCVCCEIICLVSVCVRACVCACVYMRGWASTHSLSLSLTASCV
jgi:hypothetical protein